MTTNIEDVLRKVMREEYERHDAEWMAKRKAKEPEPADKIKRSAELIAEYHLPDYPPDKWQEILDQAVRFADLWLKEMNK